MIVSSIVMRLKRLQNLIVWFISSSSLTLLLVFIHFRPDDLRSNSRGNLRSNLRRLDFKSEWSRTVLRNGTADVDEWFPLLIDKCLHGMIRRSAPCLKEAHSDSNLVYGQEVIYRSFQLAVPGFPDQADRRIWLRHSNGIKRMQISEDQHWAIYPTQYGQNLVFADAVYQGVPAPDRWAEDACVGFKVKHNQFLKQPDHSISYVRLEDPVVIAPCPDSWSLQHAQDRVFLVWMQATLALPPTARPVLVTGSEPNEGATSLYDAANITRRIHYSYGSDPVLAKHLVFPCRTPLIHPWTYIKTSKAFGWPDQFKPLNQRLDVVWFGRDSSDLYQRNTGRELENEEEFLDAVETLLENRQQGEKLVRFNPSIHGLMGNSSKYLSQNVRGVIAVHGAKLYNTRLCPKGTFILELYPNIEHYTPCFWEQARLSSQNYFLHFTEATGSSLLTATLKIKDIPKLVAVIDSNLGLEYNDRDAMQPFYPWDF